MATPIKIDANAGTGGAEPLLVTVCTDVGCRLNLSGAYQMAQAAPAQTFSFVGFDYQTVMLSAAQIATLYQAVERYVQASYGALAQVLDQIRTGTITTQEQIAPVFAALVAAPK